MKGQAAITAVIFLLFISLAIIFGLSSIALRESKISRINFDAKKSYFLAEAGEEDAVFRLKTGKNISPQEMLTLDGASVTTDIVTNGQTTELSSTGDVRSNFRKIKTILLKGTGVSFNYGVQVGEGGLEMENNSRVEGAGGNAGNVYSNGPVTGGSGATITGDVIVAGSTGQIEDAVVLGTAKANSIEDSKICGDAYYQSIDSGSLSFLNNPSSPTCSSPLTPGTAFASSPIPPSLAMPITTSTIQNWKGDAITGGTINGNCGDNGASGCNIVDNDTLYLGPKKINGNLVLTKKQTLIVTGVLYFTGNIDIDSSSGATIKCDPSFGPYSCVVIADDWIHIKNNSSFQGSGSAGSYLLVLTDLMGCNGGSQSSFCTHHNSALDLHNNATGAIFYAPDSMIYLHNGVGVTELTAYKIHLENNAIVTYEQGLANAVFSSGPSGDFDISNWLEVP